MAVITCAVLATASFATTSGAISTTTKPRAAAKRTVAKTTKRRTSSSTVRAAAATTTATPVSTVASQPNATSNTLPISYTLPKITGSVDLTKLPLGDASVSLTTAKRGGIWACRTDPTAGGAQVNGPWINTTTQTFDYTAKYIVDGDVSWPESTATFTVSGTVRTVQSNDLPKHTTGVYPIASTDDAYQVDRNPASIVAQSLSFSIPSGPVVNASPSCTPGEVGITLDGVMILNALDAPGRDAVAHETQDHCDGHPNKSGYHYHNLSRCITENTNGSARLVGWILDGFPLMSRMENGEVVTNADLDECHGHTGTVTVDGKSVTTYHYHATYEFPYTVGCMRGTATRRAQPAGGPPAGGANPPAPASGRTPPAPPAP